MATWSDVITALKNRNLIRKSLDAVVLVAESTTAVPTSFITAGSLVVPTGFTSLGWHTEDGLQWAREVSKSELTGHGSVDPLRSDTKSVSNTLQVTAMETNIVTLGLTLGVKLDPTAGTADEITIDEAVRPVDRQFRTLALSCDDTPDGEIYFGKLFVNSTVDSVTPGAWTDGDSADGKGLTIKALRDTTAGLAVRHFIGGPGFEALREDMGWDAAV